MSESAPRILVVDDERAIRRFLNTALSAQSYTIFEAESGQGAIDAVKLHRPDLIILDLGLPDLDGQDVVRILREWSRTPILILSVRDQESQKIAALDAGADDYLTKPFGMGELMARLRVLIRRMANPTPDPILTSGPLQIDLTRRQVRVEGKEIQLTPTEYDLLRILATHAEMVLTHRQLLHEVWGQGYTDELHLLRVNMSNLRRKIELDPSRPRHIITEPGVGYRLRLETPPSS
ncbi:MAG: response regulator [Caldilineaceae bacterium]|nr:response regulator [Caldilineaceae bacterium]